MKKAQLDASILKPVVNPVVKDDNFLLFAQPSPDTVHSRNLRDGLEQEEEHEETFECVREYDCKIIQKKFMNQFFLVFQQDQPVFYTQCPSSLILNPRKQVNFLLPPSQKERGE